MSVTAGTIYKFRRNDLIAACERMPQQAKPKGFRSLSKSDLQAHILFVACRVPNFAADIKKMAAKIENPCGSLLARAR